MMKKRLLVMATCLLLLMVAVMPVYANGNEWVYDEAQVVSAETEEYLKTLNEEVFSIYKCKPQLAFMVINDLPDGYTIDDYKLEQFNQLGVGTKEENRGMLFVFAINDRKYGLEIGDGFEKGSLLRKDLETDFITSDMKTLLQEEKYDEVVMQVIKRLEQMMTDEETGVYEQKELDFLIRQQQRQEKKEIARQEFFEELRRTGGLLAVTMAGFLFVYSGSVIIDKHLKKKELKKLFSNNNKYVAFLNEDEETLEKYLCETMNFSVGLDADLNGRFLLCLYDYYIEKECEKLKTKPLKASPEQYAFYLRNENSFPAFFAFETKPLDTIIYEVDRAFERNIEIEKENNAKIHAYVLSNNSRLPDYISPALLEEEMQEHCQSGVLMKEDVLETAFEEELKELIFRHDYELFLEENKDKIESRYFDSDKFYSSLKKSSGYGNDSCDNYAWMLPLLYLHMSNRKKQIQEQQALERALREKRQREQRQKEQERSMSSSSFGSGFGGGHSSGGGFSGGW